ncbi:aminopeptidase [Hydrogenophaga sp. A37]|uniref:aminopeptidase n=1 Tax=Hydrogenophaga sp. A37 TaxID=1945864 RepID=UPI00209AB1C0|nr:aminopeptidase [Hydrogenophaga sp. A37]
MALLLVANLVGGCASTDAGPGYYWQSVAGHLKMMNAARPVKDWLADPATPPALQQRLLLAQRMRRFAVTELGLPDNASYQHYADLQRRAAVYNVVAAPELSLKLHNWCFPVAGCVGYRGYFDETEAKAFAATLPTDMDVSVYPVPAYSTLGWMNWAGGDPLLNTFIGYPEGELARLLFHELAHQVVYAPGDTVFNESFATAVERIGGARWLAQADETARRTYTEFDGRRQAFRAHALTTRQRLQAVYDDAALDEESKRQAKAETMNDFRQRYEALKQGWGGYKGYDAWVAQASNATFGAQAAYDQWVPAFEALFAREGRDLIRFYDAVRALANLSAKDRRAALQALAPGAGPDFIH